MESIFGWVWIVLFAAITIVRKWHESRVEGARVGTGIPASELALRAAWALLVGVAPFVYIFSDWLAFADYPVDFPLLVSFCGAGLFGGAVWILHASHRDLGASWSRVSEPVSEGRLVTWGIYSKIRHPMYAAHLLWGVGQALLLPNWVAGAGGLVPLGLLLWIRIPREEKELLAVYGEPYVAYMARTGRLFPTGFSGESTHPG